MDAGYEASRQRSSAFRRQQSASTYNSYQAVISASWEIDIWGRIRRLNEAARRTATGQ
ncbi:MAG: hypothetical protein V5B30_19070 [Candidatus Accumulibacter delftensis]